MSSVLFDTPGPRAIRRYRLIGLLTVLGIVATLSVVIWRLWTQGQFAYELWEPFVTPRYITLLAEAMAITVGIAIAAIIGAVFFGVIFGFGKLSDHLVIRWPSWVVVEFFRAVPLLMLIIFLFFTVFGAQRPNAIYALVLGLVLYNGSVLAEVFRAGMNAVPKGQVEAAYAVGMRKSAIQRIIQLPQAAKIMLPAIVSQCIVALKDTSLGFYILAPGLTYTGREMWRTFNNQLQTALVLLLLYVILNMILERVAIVLQRRMSRGQKIELVGGVVKIADETTADDDEDDDEPSETEGRSSSTPSR